MTKTRFPVVLIIACCLFIGAPAITTTGCTQKQNGTALRPGALNEFDQATYDTLMIAQGSLRQARIEIRDNYPQYKDQFNKVAAAYNTAQSAYKVYHEAASDTAQSRAGVISATASLVTQLSALLANLGVGVTAPMPTGVK
jgi:hypothetical protein